MNLKHIPSLTNDIKYLISASQEKAIQSINFERVLLYWGIGKRIFEETQGGVQRAEYGKSLIKNLSNELEPIYGSGYSYRQLYLFVQFYKTFPNTNTVCSSLENSETRINVAKKTIVNTVCSQLNWSQYKLLIRVEDDDKREFYIAESVKNLWSFRELERQINTSLYERLLFSNDKKSVLEVARNEKLPTNPSEIIKDPMVLEFLGLGGKHSYYEKDLEGAIISNLQEFLIELGNGFSFVNRQKRLHIDGDDFFVDLVFYNRLLQCFVVFEIKTHKLTHQDIGQLQMYVNYFDRVEKQEFENPTVGVLLCADKNDTVVKYTLPQNNQTILASKYQLYLPSEEELKKELVRELQEMQTSEENK